jgi:hypothetical protein
MVQTPIKGKHRAEERQLTDCHLPPILLHYLFTMPEPIVLYDLRREAADESEYSWSPNTWKTR